MPTILNSESIYYDDVNLIAQPQSKIKSREDIPKTLDRIIVSPMAAIIGKTFALEAYRLGLTVCLHRFGTVESQLEILNEIRSQYGRATRCWVSVGLNDWDRVRKLQHTHVLVDVANGYLDSVVRFTNELLHKGYIVMVGNVHSAKGLNLYRDVVMRCGIASGCFSSDTRILMADGNYKNIVDLKVHDKIIDGTGNVTDVVAVRFMGFKKVMKYRHNRFYKHTLCTKDHRHYIHDFTNVDMSKIGAAKTAQKKQNYKWKEIESCSQDYLLLPKKINFDLPQNFEYTFEAKFKKTETAKNIKTKIVSCYNLGYIFGLFLGDGHSKEKTIPRILKDGKITTNTTTATIFYFGLDEMDICIKLKEAFKEIFNFNVKISKSKDQNMLLVYIYCAPLSRFFNKFYFNGEKKLPEDFMCSSVDYNRGLVDGLIDSDGSYGKDKRNFGNTSQYLMEVFGIACYLSEGVFPSYSKIRKSIGKLKDINPDNLKNSYTANIGPNYKQYQNEDFQMNQIKDFDLNDDLFIPVYDIEVAAENHSFVANNCIVHNSGCDTSMMTGVNRGQITEIMECREGRYADDQIICADGGIKSPGDAAKAFGAGADYVMMGGYWKNAKEAQNVIDGEFKFWGGASKYQQIKQKGEVTRHSEGKLLEVSQDNIVPLEQLVNDFWGGLSSSISYLGHDSLESFVGNGVFELKHR